jgi:hypothetical protein
LGHGPFTEIFRHTKQGREITRLRAREAGASMRTYGLIPVRPNPDKPIANRHYAR